MKPAPQASTEMDSDDNSPTEKLKKEDSDTKTRVTKGKRASVKREKKPAKAVSVIKRNKEAFDSRYKVNQHRRNVIEVLRCSNATPVGKFAGIGFVCPYCDTQFPDPRNLKQHILTIHPNITVPPFLSKRISLTKYKFKLDITSLICKLCNAPINTIEDLMTHLSSKHGKTIYTDIFNQILPFKFDSDEMKCFICTEIFCKFKQLVGHMNVHYKNYCCDKCEAGFVNLAGLLSHNRIHEIQELKCNYCSKMLKNRKSKQAHEQIVHKRFESQYTCEYCGEVFVNYMRREVHFAEVHGLKIAEAKCTACNKVYKNHSTLKQHIKMYHLMMRHHKCPECEKTFYASAQLRMHMIHHTRVKEFQCDICSKCLATKQSLIAHINRHTAGKKFKCNLCDKAYKQGVTLDKHMLIKHGGIV